MPLDPLIALAYKPANIQTPNEVAQQQANIQNTQNAGALQKQQIQENQRALDAQKSMNQALQSSTTKDPVTGAPVIDYDGVVSKMTQAGFGREAMTFRQNVNALKTSDANLQELQQRIQYDHLQHIGAMAGAVLDAPEAVRGKVYQDMTSLAQQAGYLKPGQLPPQYTPQVDASLGALRESATTAEQQYGAKFNEGKISMYQLRAQEAEDRANAATERLKTVEQNSRYQMSTFVDAQGRPLSFDRSTGTYTPTQGIKATQPNVEERTRHDRAMEGIGQQNADTRAASVTSGEPGTDSVQGRFDAKQQRQDRTRLDAIHRLRDAVGSALETPDDQQVRVPDPNTGRPGQPQPMTDQLRSSLTTQFNDLTNEGVRNMKRNGWPNEFKDQAGQQAYGSTPSSTPSSTAPAPTKGAIAAPAGYRRPVTDGKGNWLAINNQTNKWEKIPAPKQ